MSNGPLTARRRDLHTASQRPFRSPRNRQQPSHPRLL